ncbi:MAG: hypothetical protein OYH77_02325 [Pseudomonadota bacterium]|nr:hypothetical protein [Pseudomonadota bacterium]
MKYSLVLVKLVLVSLLLASCRGETARTPVPENPELGVTDNTCNTQELNNRIALLEAEKNALLAIKKDLETKLKASGAQPPSAQDKVNHIVEALCPPIHTIGGAVCGVFAQAQLTACGIVDQGGGNYIFNEPTQACQCWIREYLTGQDHC